MLEIKAKNAAEIWTIERPDRRNGIGTTLALALDRALQQLRHRLATGSGPRALIVAAKTLTKDARHTWIAGGDLKELAALLDQPLAARSYAATMSAVCCGLSSLPIPVIMAVDGAAIGGGAELMLAGDIRLASAQASVEMRQLDVGLATGYGGCKRLVDLVGLARAQYLLFAGTNLSAPEALQLGLFHEVHADKAALDDAVERWVGRFERLAPEALAAQKTMFHAAVTAHPGAAANAELAAFGAAWANPKHRDFLARFLEQGAEKP